MYTCKPTQQNCRSDHDSKAQPNRTDFGISRSFTQNEGSQTESPTSMTRRWCSPEVASQQPRGRASDIFSLGCVFIEMCTVVLQIPVTKFEEYRSEDGSGDAFHLCLPRVREWIKNLYERRKDLLSEEELWIARSRDLHRILPPSGLHPLLMDMVDEIPGKRPTSTQVISRMEGMVEEQPEAWRVLHPWYDNEWNCCNQPPESYRVAEEDEIYDAFHFDREFYW